MFAPQIKWRKVKNANARNHILFIEIEPHMPLSTLAQEIAEWQFKARVFIPVGLLSCAAGAYAGYLAAGWFGAGMFGFVTLMAGTVFSNNAVSGTRDLEYWGRAVDWQAGGDLARLVRELAGYGQFRNAVPESVIHDEIVKRGAKAGQWVEDNYSALQTEYCKRNK